MLLIMLRAFFGGLRAFLGNLGTFLGNLGAFLGGIGESWGLLGWSWVVLGGLGAFLGLPGAFLEGLGPFLGRVCGLLRAATHAFDPHCVASPQIFWNLPSRCACRPMCGFNNVNAIFNRCLIPIAISADAHGNFSGCELSRSNDAVLLSGAIGQI